jgi:immune inhibitor A
MKIKKRGTIPHNCLAKKYMVQKRLLGPKTFKKALITNNLLNKGIKNENVFLENGGLDKNQYQTFKNELNQRSMVTDELIENTPDKQLQGRNPLFGIDEEQFAVEGTMKVLVLLVEFENRKHQTEPNYFKNLLFSTGVNYSMRDYFYEVSGGKLIIEGHVTEWTTLVEYENYLVERNNGETTWIDPDSEKIVFDALENGHENNLLPGFSYDYFDTLIVVGAGTGFNRTLKYEDISPHRGPLNKHIVLGNNLIDHYIMINELPEYDLGGYCHEFAHELGLPDLYADDGQSIVVGRWCLMGAGSYNNGGRNPSHLSAWCKWKLGWVKTQEINGQPDFYEIPSINSEKIIYRLNVPYSNGKEYYLIENRQQTGFDKDIPGNGLLIWHINENGFFRGSPNINVSNLALTLKQADGKRDLEQSFVSREFLDMIEKTFGGDEGDIFPGKTNNRTLNPDSNPNSDSYSGYNSGIVISSISDSSDMMKALMGYEYLIEEEYAETIPLIKYPLLISSFEPSCDINQTSAEYWEGYEKGYKEGYQFLKENTK